MRVSVYGHFDRIYSEGKKMLLVESVKTVTIQNFLGSLDPEKYLTLNINFSSRTSSRRRRTTRRRTACTGDALRALRLGGAPPDSMYW